MILLKRVEKDELPEAVAFANSIFGCGIPAEVVPKAAAMISWSHDLELEETIHTLVDEEGEVLFEVSTA